LGIAKVSRLYQKNEKKHGIDRNRPDSINVLESETDPLLLEDLKTSKNLQNKELYKIKYICSNNHNFCGKCMKMFHYKTNCEDDKEILDFGTDSGKMIKKCPNCRTWTEKDEGCNHMHCKICNYDWCWLCEENCPQDHYLKRGTPCYGKQFNDQGDPDIELMLMLQDQDSFFPSIIFFFILSFLVVSGVSRQLLYENNRRNNTSKMTVIIALFCMLFIIELLLFLFNGIITMYMITSLGKFRRIRSTHAKAICSFSFFLLWPILYFFGFTLALFWLVVMIFYSLYKVCSL